MNEEIDESFKQSADQQKTVVYAVSGLSASFAAGIVSYLLRAGSLMSSFLATMPVWSNFDPVAILVKPSKNKKIKKKGEEVKETKPSQEQQAENMFDVDHQ